MKKATWLLNLLVNLTSISTYAANPASTAYVDQQVQNLQTQIDNIQPGIMYTAGTGISITGSVIANSQPGITYTAGTGINITGSVITNSQPGTAFHVGDYYQGGVIYWLDPTQSYEHGLIADIADNPGTYQWSVAFTTTGATLNGAYQGQNTSTFNTAKILTTPGTTYPAASACATSTSQGFSDWYLPSLMELSQMFNEQMTIRQTSLANGGGLFH